MNIHGHTILTKLKVSSKVWDEQAAFVRGYILALEDILGDVAEYRARVIRQRSLTDPYQAAYGIADMVHETWTQARATLVALEQIEAEADTKGDWRCARCSSPRWVGWRNGPEHEGWPRRAQCVPCGHVQDLPINSTKE